MRKTWQLCCGVVGVVMFFGMGLVQPCLTQAGGAGDITQPQVSSHRDYTDQLIIKHRDPSVARAAVLSSKHVDSLSTSAGLRLKHFRAMSGDAHIVKLPHRMTLAEAEKIAKRLNADPAVEYAEPDRLMFPVLSPNDPLYANQWHYKTPGPPDNERGAVNMPGAWDITTGSNAIVVAVIDTGIVTHADLAGRTVPGYNFISDPTMAGNGIGRSPDASDLGDWEWEDLCYPGSPVSNSSWHGTHVAGTIGAATNNNIGVAGVNWASKILPVRVLGKCAGYKSGYESDVVDGARWAAGLSVSGVPDNTNPAKVLNLSLGTEGACSQTIQTAINDFIAAGGTIIAAVGNSNSDVSGFTPANCNGVISVAAVNRTGGRASYSNYGTIVKIAAPGGEQSYQGDPNGVLSALNSGVTAPVPSPGGDIYQYYQGTSMAAPHVSGIVSLMLSKNNKLTSNQILSLVQTTARTFPTWTGSIGGDCTTSLCGAGIIDAAAAVAAVTPDPAYAWHTFYGSRSVNAIAVDGGDVYVAGNSDISWNGPSGEAPLNAFSGAYNIFIMKLDSTGTYQWHAFYGAYDGRGIAADGSGNVYITGHSSGSWNGPSGQAPLNSGFGAFVLKLSSNGEYQWHTFYGAYEGSGIAADGSGNVYVTGNSAGSWNGSSGQAPLNAYSGSWDLFLLKLNSTGIYQWHTFYGSGVEDIAHAIAVEKNGNVYVTGYSNATWGSPRNAFSGSTKILVLKLDNNGIYQWHTFYGSGSLQDNAYGIDVDESGNVFMIGYSNASWNGPSGQAPLHDASPGGFGAFVLKLSSNGDYQWHTFYSSFYNSYGTGFNVAVSGCNVYAMGISESSWNGPSGQAPRKAYSGMTDIVVLKLSSSGAYKWHTFYGALQTDVNKGMASDGSGNVYMTGTSEAFWNGPSGAAPIHAYSGSYRDIFVLKLTESSLYTNFAGYGLYKWDGTAWSQLNTIVPASMVASGSVLYSNFTGYGLYSWNGTAWTQINTVYPESMVTSGSLLYADFAGYGLYTWNGTTWIQINTVHPASMVASGSVLYANFAGYGLYKYDGSAWSQLNTIVPESMTASGSILYANFAGYGLYKWNGAAWSQLNTIVPANMVASGSTLYADFAGYGLYSWNGTAWTQINTVHPASMVAVGSTLYANFAGYGLYKWEGSTWTQINAVIPESMVASGSLLYANFAGYGLYQWNGTTWTQINTVHPASMVAGF
jgi:subtilisin family serine protease